MDGFHQQCVESAAAILEGLGIPGIGSVIRQFFKTDATLPEPSLVLSTEGLALSIKPLTTNSREVGYPISLRVVDRVFRPGDERMPEWFGWEDLLIGAFPRGRIDAYPAGVHDVELTNRAGVDRIGRGYQLAEGEWLLLFWTTVRDRT